MMRTILEKFFLPIGDIILGTCITQNLHSLRNSSFSEENTKNKLHGLLKHASTNSQYYKKLNIQSDIDPIKWLKKFPVLDKQTLRDHQKDLLTTPKEKLLKNSSSGSTGFQSTVYWTKEEQSLYRATQLFWWEWAGYRIGDPILQTGINPNRTVIKSIKDRLFNTYYLQAFSHSREEAKSALMWASKQKEPVLAGYASSLYVLALYAEEINLRIRFKTAISWGDKLFDHYRKKIEQVFSTKVFETYGSAEGLMIASQYDLPYMYLMNSHVYLEICDNCGNEVEDGQLGNVIVTNLNAYAMPLIRYKLGDLAIKMPLNEYPSERKVQLPILKKVIGRDTDLVKTTSGKYMVVHSFTGIFEHIPEIQQFCVIQYTLDGITIQYIKGPNFKSEILTTVKNQILDYLREPFEITFTEVNEIPATKSGKPQLIVSKLS
jgi:phenylacetate-CoA ligase